MGIGLELHKTGTIRYVNLEGGFYGIVGDNGHDYNPIHPPPQNCQVDGLRVAFVATTREDYTGFSMWGQPIELITIDPVYVGGGAEEESLAIVIIEKPWYKEPWIWVGVGAFILLAGRIGKERRKKK